MKIDTQPRDDHQAKLVVAFEDGTLDEYKKRAARELANRIRVPGFRPGRAPYNVILRQVGEAALTEEALERLVRDRYPDIVAEAGIKPYSAGELENIASTDPLVLEFVVPLEPVIVLGDYKAIRREYEPSQINESDVDGVLQNLREQQAVLEPVTRPAGESDIVSVRLSAERSNPAEGQDALLIGEDSYQFLVRAEAQAANDEWPYPGFSQQLAGMSTGESKALSYTFPEDYELESLRSAEANYQLEVEGVKSRTLPELNDEFVKSVDKDYADLDALRADIQKSLESESLDRYNKIYADGILAELIEQSTIKYPPQMLVSEQNNIIENFKHRLEHQGTDFELYLKTRNMDLEAFTEEVKPVAEQRLKRSLVLLELSKAEGIQVSEEELQAETMQTLRSLNESLSPDDARRLSDERIMNNLVGNLMLEMLTERAEQRLHDIAAGIFPPAVEESEVPGESVLAGTETTTEMDQTSVETENEGNLEGTE